MIPRKKYKFIMRLNIKQIVRCDGEWHWIYVCWVGDRIKSRRRNGYGKCDCKKEEPR